MHAHGCVYAVQTQVDQNPDDTLEPCHVELCFVIREFGPPGWLPLCRAYMQPQPWASKFRGVYSPDQLQDKLLCTVTSHFEKPP